MISTEKKKLKAKKSLQEKNPSPMYRKQMTKRISLLGKKRKPDHQLPEWPTRTKGWWLLMIGLEYIKHGSTRPSLGKNISRRFYLLDCMQSKRRNVYTAIKTCLYKSMFHISLGFSLGFPNQWEMFKKFWKIILSLVDFVHWGCWDNYSEICREEDPKMRPRITILSPPWLPLLA